MGQNSKILSNTGHSSDLVSKIMGRIATERRRREKIRSWAYGGGSALSFSMAGFSFFYFYNSFAQSGFSQYTSLVFSGDASVFLYWKELLMSLAETVPVIEVFLFLIALVLFLWLSARLALTINSLHYHKEITA